MSSQDPLTQLADEFERRPSCGKARSQIAKAERTLGEFLLAFPYRREPTKIDDLARELVWRPGSAPGTMFYWMRHALADIGFIGERLDWAFERASQKIEMFRSLLRLAVDDGRTLAEKVDGPWQEINGFGGDRVIAKKIICCYYPELTLSTFKIDDLRLFAERLQIDLDPQSNNQYAKSFEELTPGEKWQFLNDSLLAENVPCQTF